MLHNGKYVVIILYEAPDNASLIVKIILQELGLDYKTVLVDRTAHQQSGKAYLRLNPKGLIPVCIIDGEPVFETAAICLFLADKHTTLAPSAGDPSRPHFLKWLFFLSNTLHSDLRLLFYPEKYVEKDIGQFREKTRERLVHSFGILEKHYRELDTLYLIGNNPTIVDIYLALCMRWVQLYPAQWQRRLNVADFPSIEKMLTALEARPQVVKACQSDGITGRLFTSPDYARPEKGSAT